MFRISRLLRISSSPLPYSYTKLTSFTESFSSNEKDIQQGDTRWIDGVRGIAAIMVVVSHLVISLHDSIIFPATPEAMRTNWVHWPFLHAPFEGFPWLATFFILSGWVNAIKPIALANAREPDKLLTSVSTSALRRSLRLMLPPTITTFGSWVLAQMGAYGMAHARGNDWMRSTSPSASATWGLAVRELGWSVYTNWTTGTNYYDGNQWCMLSFLRGSMTLYLVVMATARATPGMRRLILGALWLWSWRAHDEFVAIPTYSGILFAELSSVPGVYAFASSHTVVQNVVSLALFVAGWFMISVPNIHMDWATWYSFVFQDGGFKDTIYPGGGTVFHLTNYLGLFLLFAGILFSTSLQRFFVKPVFLWLGKLSLPIYLIHGPVLRTLGCWLLFGFTAPSSFTNAIGADGAVQKIPTAYPPLTVTREVFAVFTFFATVLFLASQWNDRVEPWCALVTKTVEDIVTGKRQLASITLGAMSREENGTANGNVASLA
ncbi:hypothetical protein BT63DRAFT_483060 [Microthyrium microscopicum]|uniref:Acyltransferase 3 domain-containing protein n=1 Tax=Microthyrium microscopicum TaxID=703497 RepID=A0A6A6TYN0_9PEZI|nr:hypothetical protein BT63DRAFT_483060 [Microthyrium microscopicum]